MKTLFIFLLLLCPIIGLHAQSVSPPSGGGSGGTVTSVSGTAPVSVANGTTTPVVSITGVAGQVLGGAGPAFTATPALGTDGSVAGTVQLSNGAAAAHNIFGSAATTSNTILGFATAPTTGNLIGCVTATTVCTLTDTGVLASTVVTTLTTTGSSGAATLTGHTLNIPTYATSGGTVTNFTAGTLSPLFTTSVATATSTPALTFALTNAAQNSVFAGPAAGGAGAPSYQTAPTFSAANLTSFPTFNQNTTGTAAGIAGGATNNVLYQTGAGATGFVTPVNSAVLVTNGSAVPSESTTLPSGLTIPGYQATLSLTTGGTTGSATLISNVLNIPDYSSSTQSGGSSGWSGLPLTFVTNATQYASPVGGSLTSTTESMVQLKASAAATLSGLQVTLSASLGTGATIAVTLRDGGVSQALTCTTATAGTTCSDTTHSVNVAQGDLLDFLLVSSGMVTAGLPQVEIGYAVGTSGVGVTSVTCGTGLTGGTFTTTGTCAVSGSAGQILAGATPALTSTPTLGASGTLGSLTFGNATSGTVTLQPVTGALGSVTASLPANTGTIAELNLAQSWSATQTFTTPVLGAATATSLVATGIVAGQAPINVVTGSTFTFGTTGGSYVTAIYVNENATAGTAVTGTLPTAAAGDVYCVGNGYNGSAANTGALEILTSASGQFIIYTDGTLSATGGYVISGGAGADFACVFGVDSTHWMFRPGNGTWSKH